MNGTSWVCGWLSPHVFGCLTVYRVAQKAVRNLMRRHFATVRRRINKDRCLPVNFEFVSGLTVVV